MLASVRSKLGVNPSGLLQRCYCKILQCRDINGTCRSVSNLLTLADYEAHANEVLDKNAWDYYSSGANQEQTLRDNVEAFKRYRLHPRMLQDVSKIDMRVQLLNEWSEFPICVSPTGMQGLAHPDGEVATARACFNLGTCMTLSTWSTASLEKVARSCNNGLKWFQLYIYENKEFTASLINRAEEAGYKALAITVDTPAEGNRLTDPFTIPPHLTLGNFGSINNGSDTWQHPYNASCNWSDIDWVRGMTDLSIVVKGILTREDAIEAVRRGVQGILVSNHGGRQLDGVPATIDVLSEVVEAVGDKVEVFLDGGVRQGTDVLKAVALGAKAVFIGRPVLWGLAYKGSEGVENVLTILRDELKLAMVLAGCSSLADISRDLVVHESYYKAPHIRL